MDCVLAAISLESQKLSSFHKSYAATLYQTKAFFLAGPQDSQNSCLGLYQNSITNKSNSKRRFLLLVVVVLSIVKVETIRKA